MACSSQDVGAPSNEVTALNLNSLQEMESPIKMGVKKAATIASGFFFSQEQSNIVTINETSLHRMETGKICYS